MAIITHPATLRWLTSLPLRGKEVKKKSTNKKIPAEPGFCTI